MESRFEPKVEKKRIQSVSRAARILRLFAGNEVLSLSQISRSLAFNPSSVHHVVQTLADEGFLRQDPNSRHYSLGPALLSLVHPGTTNAAVLTAAEPHLAACSRATGFDVWLAVLELDRVYYIARVDGESPLKVHMPLLKLQPAHCVAAGRVMLSGLGRERARVRLALHTIRQMTAATVTDVEAVLDRIDMARKQGFSEVEDEHIAGASDIAVPVFGTDQVIIAAVSVGAPTHVFDARRRADALPHLLRCSAEIHASFLGQVNHTTAVAITNSYTRKSDLAL